MTTIAKAQRVVVISGRVRRVGLSVCKALSNLATSIDNATYSLHGSALGRKYAAVKRQAAYHRDELTNLTKSTIAQVQAANTQFDADIAAAVKRRDATQATAHATHATVRDIVVARLDKVNAEARAVADALEEHHGL